MDAQRFLDRLKGTLPDHYPPGEVGFGADWTRWMVGHLHRMQHDAGYGCCCHHSDEEQLVGIFGDDRSLHVHKEYLFDLTWYRPEHWTIWGLPDVVIEHENSHSEAAFLIDQWKLFNAWAPLRVMFGYTHGPGGWAERLSKLNQIGAAHGHRFPAGVQQVEDICLVGHGNMGPRDFRILFRKHDCGEWKDLGLLGSWEVGAIR